MMHSWKEAARFGLICGVLATVGCGGGGDDDEGVEMSPVENCEATVAVICKKAHGGCLDDETLEYFSPVLGNNEVDCRTRLGGDNCTEETTRCDSGTEYQPAMGRECVAQLTELSCSQFVRAFITDEGSTPAACESDQICQ